MYQFHWYRLIKGWIHLCRVFLLNNLYIANIFNDFFLRNSIICSSIDLEQIGFFDKGSLDILLLSNVKISPLSTNFVTFNSSDLAWLSFSVFETFYTLPMTMWSSIIWFRNFRFSSCSNEIFTVNSVILFLSWRFGNKCSILLLFVQTFLLKMQISIKRRNSFIAIDCEYRSE